MLLDTPRAGLSTVASTTRILIRLHYCKAVIIAPDWLLLFLNGFATGTVYSTVHFTGVTSGESIDYEKFLHTKRAEKSCKIRQLS